MGPFSVEDTFWMEASCVLLHRTLDKDHNTKYIHFLMERKIRSVSSNTYHSSKELEQVAATAFQTTKSMLHCVQDIVIALKGSSSAAANKWINTLLLTLRSEEKVYMDQ
mmetsp:Transcript_33986/g.38679  ORF Transcript_33986/g.38679 Transcript_33986/m.38679 type:complete len:109 (+) Transcript_33986:1217-1543(+)